MFGQGLCPWCDKAREELAGRGAEFRYHTFDDKELLAAFRERFPEARTVPQVFRNGRRIGGYEDLIRHFGGQFSHH